MSRSAPHASGPMTTPSNCAIAAFVLFTSANSAIVICLHQPRNEINYEPDRNPAQHYEIPVIAILRSIHEALAVNWPGKEQHGKHTRIKPIGKQVDGVQAEQRPDH